jgi:hypothetical protein
MSRAIAQGEAQASYQGHIARYGLGVISRWVVISARLVSTAYHALSFTGAVPDFVHLHFRGDTIIYCTHRANLHNL